MPMSFQKLIDKIWFRYFSPGPKPLNAETLSKNYCKDEFRHIFGHHDEFSGHAPLCFHFFCEVIAQKKRQPVSSFGVVPMAPRRKSGEAPMKRLKSGHNLEDCFAGKFPATRTFTTWLYHPWFFWIYLQ